MSDDNQKRWGFSLTADLNEWTADYATRAEAIVAGLEQVSENESIWVVCGDRGNKHDYFPDAEMILQNAQEHLDEETGEDSTYGREDGWLSAVKTEAGDELDTFLEAWVEKYVPAVPYWVVDENTAEQVDRASYTKGLS